MSQLSLILGGVRSGKSAFAERLAGEVDGPTLYVATGQPTDAEMEHRIRRHRERRPAHWVTIEEPLDLPGCLDTAPTRDEPAGSVLIDSLDAWVANMMMEHGEQGAGAVESSTMCGVERLLKMITRTSASVLLVSSEVGLSLVSPDPLGRQFQDLLGRVNQRVASAADRVYLVVAGIPTEIKVP